MAAMPETKVQPSPGPWSVLEPSKTSQPFTLADGEHNDLAEFFHSEQATVPTPLEQARENAALTARLVNLYLAGKAAVAAQEKAVRDRGDLPADASWGLTENESAAAMMMNGMLSQWEAMLTALQQAESFIAGFEGDELQEGVDAMLEAIRAAIAKAGGR